MPMNQKRFFSNQSGFSLVQTMIALGILSGLIAGAMNIFGWTAKLQNDAMNLAQLELTKTQIINTLSNPDAWAKTIELSGPQAKMGCLKNKTSCPPNPPSNFILYDITGSQVVVDGIDSKAGFSPRGSPCTTFSMNGGDDACPFRFDIKWQAVCDPSDSSTCIQPLILINAHLYYRPKTIQQPINEDLYSINSFYIPRPAKICKQGNQQAIFFSDTPNVSVSTPFKVPPYTNRLVVEMWGGGGGGGGSNGLWGINPGSPGGTSQFVAPSRTITATGGIGGGGISQPSWVCCWDDPAWCVGIGAGFNWGAPGAPNTNPGNLNNLPPGSCAPKSSTTVPGGASGGPSAPGKIYAGGGSGGWALWGNAQNSCPIAAVFATGGQGGQYNQYTFTPAELPPGTLTTVTAGAGGLGAWGTSAVWTSGGPLIIPNRGGDGARGIVKITWE